MKIRIKVENKKTFKKKKKKSYRGKNSSNLN